MHIDNIPIDMIDVTERRRTDFGDLEGLTEGIKRGGLLSPILVDRNGGPRYRLIFGERRLKAVQSLGLKKIPALLREQLTEAEFRDIELEENENRKALTKGERERTFESAKKLVAKAKKAEEFLIRNKSENATDTSTKTKKGKGRPPGRTTASTRAVAAALGTTQTTLVQARQHVETAEQFTFMQGKEWRQSQVLAVREAFETLPEAERPKAAGVLACARMMDPGKAVELVRNIANKPVKERNELYRLGESDHPRDRSLALTKSAELPPMPDLRILAFKSRSKPPSSLIALFAQESLGSFDR